MSVLTVQHMTAYHCARPVSFGPHRLMLRPRDGHDLRVLATQLDISPAATSRWIYDALGNSVTQVSFAEPASELRIVSRLTIERFGSRPPRGEVEASAARYPFVYSMQDRFDLGRMLEQHYMDPADLVGAWARGFVRGPTTDTLALLADLNAGIRFQFGYQSRDEEGTQSPVETLSRSCGSCRDFAVLLAEAARGLGQKHGWSPAISSLSGTLAPPGRSYPIRPTPGPRSTCPDRAGSPTTRPTRPSAGRI